MSNVILLEELL